MNSSTVTCDSEAAADLCANRLNALALTKFVHHIDRGSDMVDGCRGQDAVTEVENVPETSPGSSQDIFYAAFDFVERRK